jgi:DNA recombination protein RmuC
MTAVVVALVIGVFAGALVVWMVTRGLSQESPNVMESQGEIKARLEDTLAHVQRIGAIFANAAQRGRAGELVLENLLEATGMGQHRDFDVQVGADGVRPDVVLNLPGRGHLVIDAKFPLDDFQRAAATASDDDRRKAMTAHARAVLGHVRTLAKRGYPSKIKNSIDFVVCFVPSEDLLAAAYDEYPSLFYDAIRDRVLLATPATLMALLWGVAFGWQQDARVKQAQQVGDIAAELHQRFGILVKHMQKAGRSLNTAVTSYNAMVGSFEARVLPQVRKFEDLGILAPGTHLPESETIEAHTRPAPLGPYFEVDDVPPGEIVSVPDDDAVV